MLYRNDDPRAILAMEVARTGNYGEGDYYDSYDHVENCPLCGAYEPECLYVNDDDECIGCYECVHIVSNL